MAIEHAVFVERLSNDAANKLEEAQMLRVDTRHSVGMESRAVRGDRDEQRVVSVKHLSRHDLEPLSRDTASIDSLLAVEPDAELGILDLVASLVVHALVRVQKHLVAANIKL